MGAYKSPFRAAITPSLLILILQTASILCADSVLFGSAAELPVMAGAFLAGAAVSIAVIVRTGPRSGGAIEPVNAAQRAALFLCITLIICAAPFIGRIMAVHPEKAPAIGNETAMLVTLKKEKRYADELTVVASNKRDGAIGLIVHEGSTPAGEGDIITVDSRAVTMDPARKDMSPFMIRQIRRGVRFIMYTDREGLKILEKNHAGIRKTAREKVTALSGSLFTAETSAFVEALLLGNQSRVSKKTISDFRRAGVLHVLAASGTHVGILASIPLLLFGALRLNKKAVLVSASALAWCYLAVTDMPVSLARACVMFTVFTAQRVLSLGGNPMNALFISAIAVLLAWPCELFELGFQLSFGATAGIIMLYPLYRRALPASGPKNRIASSISLTLAAQAAVMPVILGRLGEINIVSVLSNILIVPMVALIFYGALFTMSLSGFSAAAAGHAGTLCDMIYRALSSLAGFFSGMNGHFTVDRPGPFLLAAYALMLAPVFPVLRHKAAAAASIALAHVLLAVSLAHPEGPPNGQAIRFCSGPGRALLVREKDDLCLVGPVDRPDAAREISAEIEKTRYRSLFLYMTDAGRENVRQYTRIMKNCRVDEIHVPASVRLDRGFMSLCRVAQRDGVSMKLYGQSGKGLKNNPGNGIIASALERYRASEGEIIPGRFNRKVHGPVHHH